jgi:hypothetical protein
METESSLKGSKMLSAIEESTDKPKAMTAEEILAWLEGNMKQFLVVPPESKHDYPDFEIDPAWSIYHRGHVFVASGTTLAECVAKSVERINAGYLTERVEKCEE